MDIPGILCYVPDILDKYEVGTLPLMNIDSSNMGPQHWFYCEGHRAELQQLLMALLFCTAPIPWRIRAAALSYLCRNLGKPVVLTGAQMPISESTSDGKRI